MSYLTDALGFTVRLTDGAGNKLVDYTYDPYGVTTAGAAVGNPFTYPGRENDGNGLCYYRARHYSPGMKGIRTAGQYALRENAAGWYPIMTRGFREPTELMWGEAGEVWKYGTSKHLANDIVKVFG